MCVYLQTFPFYRKEKTKLIFTLTVEVYRNSFHIPNQCKYEVPEIKSRYTPD